MTSALQNQFQIAVLSESHDGMAALSGAASLEWLRAKRTGKSSFVFLRGEEKISEVDLETGCFDLSYLLGMVVVGDADTFSEVKSNWNAKLVSSGLSFRLVSEWNTQSILCAAMECVTECLAEQREHSGRTALQLAVYRREFDRLQGCFTRLEEYLAAQPLQRMTEVFSYPPDSGTGLKGDPKAQLQGAQLQDVTYRVDRKLKQPLPVNSLGVSSLSIYISTKPEPAAGPLSVVLQGIEGGAAQACWLLDTAAIQVGWVELALNRALDLSAESLELSIESKAGDGSWIVALGPPHPYREFCARVEGGEPLRSPIALRIFSGLPGVRVATTANAIRPMGAEFLPLRMFPLESYESAIQVLPAVRDGKPRLVFFDLEIDSLTVHPRMEGLTVARLTVAIPKHAWGLSAQICLAHKDANPTDFGLMICEPQNEKKSLARMSQLEAPSPSFSGWKTLPALETGSISLVFSAYAEKSVSLFLITRQAPESSPDFAWARFSNLAFQILPISSKTEIEADALSSVTV